jgi:hypothetical protein
MGFIAACRLANNNITKYKPVTVTLTFSIKIKIPILSALINNIKI